MSTVSNHSLTLFQTCPLKYKFEMIDRRVPAEVSEPLTFGSVAHKYLEALWSHTHLDPTRFRLAVSTDDPYLDEEILAMIQGYEARWGTPPKSRAEVEFRVQVLRGWELIGRVDALMPHGDSVRVVEHKFTTKDASPGSPYWEEARMSQQVGLYSIAYGVSFPVMFDVVRRTGLTPKLRTPPDKVRIKKDGEPYANVRLEDEHPQEFGRRVAEALGPENYVRVDLVRLEAEHRQQIADLKRWVALIADATVRDSFPRNTNSCFGKYGRCPYLPVCSGQARLTSPIYKDKDVIHDKPA